MDPAGVHGGGQIMATLLSTARQDSTARAIHAQNPHSQLGLKDKAHACLLPVFYHAPLQVDFRGSFALSLPPGCGL